MKYLAISKKIQTNLLLLLAVTLIFSTFAISVSAEDVENVSLTVTDDGKWVLNWVQRINVYPFDPAKGVDGSKESGVVESVNKPSNPVEFLLPPDQYLISITVLEYGRSEIEIIVGNFDLNGDKAVNLFDADLPFEVFIPA